MCKHEQYVDTFSSRFLRPCVNIERCQWKANQLAVSDCDIISPWDEHPPEPQPCICMPITKTSVKGTDCISEIGERSTWTGRILTDETLGIKCQNSVEVLTTFRLDWLYWFTQWTSVCPALATMASAPPPRCRSVYMAFGKRIRWEITSEGQKFADEIIEAPYMRRLSCVSSRHRL